MPSTKLFYYNERLLVGMANWKIVFQFGTPGGLPVQLYPELHRGQLVYRLPGSSRRISYKQIKKGLVKKATEVVLPDLLIPF